MEPQPVVRVVSAPILVMGVSGSGKSTVGEALAQRLRVPYLDADDLHPQANIDKMAAGAALDDDDRYPWLERVGQWLADHHDGGVVGCSALKRSYRDQLRQHCAHAQFLHLNGSPELIRRRVASRTGHFMPAGLIRSQFDTLEPLGDDEGGVVVDLAEEGQDVQAILEAFLVSATNACDDR